MLFPRSFPHYDISALRPQRSSAEPCLSTPIPRASHKQMRPLVPSPSPCRAAASLRWSPSLCHLRWPFLFFGQPPPASTPVWGEAANVDLARARSLAPAQDTQLQYGRSFPHLSVLPLLPQWRSPPTSASSPTGSPQRPQIWRPWHSLR